MLKNTGGKNNKKDGSKWFIDLSAKCKTIHISGDNIGESQDNIGFGYDFLDTTPLAWFRKENMISWTSLKLNTSALKKMLLKVWKDKALIEIKISAKHTSDISKI